MVDILVTTGRHNEWPVAIRDNGTPLIQLEFVGVHVRMEQADVLATLPPPFQQGSVPEGGGWPKSR